MLARVGLCGCMQESKLLQMNIYNKVYKTIANKLAEKGQRASVHKDSQDGTVEDAPSPEQYFELIQYLMKEAEHDGKAVRDLSIFLFMTMSVGRCVPCHIYSRWSGIAVLVHGSHRAQLLMALLVVASSGQMTAAWSSRMTS